MQSKRLKFTPKMHQNTFGGRASCNEGPTSKGGAERRWRGEGVVGKGGG